MRHVTFPMAAARALGVVHARAPAAARAGCGAWAVGAARVAAPALLRARVSAAAFDVDGWRGGGGGGGLRGRGVARAFATAWEKGGAEEEEEEGDEFSSDEGGIDGAGRRGGRQDSDDDSSDFLPTGPSGSESHVTDEYGNSLVRATCARARACVFVCMCVWSCVCARARSPTAAAGARSP